MNVGDDVAVRDLSCTRDRTAFASGESGNPAALAGQVRLTVTSVITARPRGLAYFTATPALNGQKAVKSFMTRQDGEWRMCVTATKAEDL